MNLITILSNNQEKYSFRDDESISTFFNVIKGLTAMRLKSFISIFWKSCFLYIPLLHSAKSELMFCAGENPASGVSDYCSGWK